MAERSSNTAGTHTNLSQSHARLSWTLQKIFTADNNFAINRRSWYSPTLRLGFNTDYTVWDPTVMDRSSNLKQDSRSRATWESASLQRLLGIFDRSSEHGCFVWPYEQSCELKVFYGFRVSQPRPHGNVFGTDDRVLLLRCDSRLLWG